MTHVPCICGAHRPPKVIRRGTASVLLALQCPRCRRRTVNTRPELLDEAWQRLQADERAKQLNPGVQP